ncbi:winged helix DNA-binding domain-containing protein [Conexibacter stalactiti]|uniref:Winged helix DNA-binding domain-containing protein n=1 Tax=Conexibacter stalactiti TaxID=1940611 RepID=A0ABU4HY36_9ACTN|nr:winged helix DNA-binding domain-containing protein [Conexibacter stalactiti]MDW5596974.1 winged helix DNA-binding domain-containing protein [Conexibacter stalactiti]MEC5037616.1 winged helix DNA-binding domain-containing protein [Conexibacter stalactiti]
MPANAERPARVVSAQERRARLGRRQLLAPEARAATVEQATERIVCLHATDPATVYLSAWARVEALRVTDLERALYADRSLVKHMAMRRTLFVFPRATMPDAQAGASARVADVERRRLIADVERAGLKRDGARWLREGCTAVLATLADGRELSSTELRDELPLLEGSISYGEGKSWAGKMPIGPRVLTVLSAEGLIVRASNVGGWTSSRPRWTAMGAWLGEELAPRTAQQGVAGLVERWLRAFGPGTEADLKWWLGGTLRAVRAALVEIGAVPVALVGDDSAGDGTVRGRGAATGWLMPDDLDPVAAPAPWAALLPPLDPTTMGWTERDFYLGSYRPQLFDSAGNAGPTAWWEGRIVGGWRQREDGSVELQLLEDPGDDGRRALDAEAARLTAWLEGVRLLPRFPSPLSKALAER